MKRTPFAGAAALLVLAGCSSTDAAPAAGADGELTSATVGVIPISDTAPLYLGKEKGFFEDAGIDLKIETAAGGAAIVPAVVSGEYQFGFSNTLSLMLAHEQGLPLKMLSSASATTGDTSDDFGAIVVPEDSDLRSAADLAGKSVSTNSLNNINDTVTRTVVDAAGGDSSTIEFVEVPFPDAAGVLAQGDIDAAFVVEPFLTGAVAAGNRVVTYAYAEMDPRLDVAVYFGAENVDEDLAAAFQEAITQSLEYAHEHPDEVREIISTYTETPADVLAEITLPTFPTTIDRAAQEKLAAAAQEYGVLNQAPDLDALLP